MPAIPILTIYIGVIFSMSISIQGRTGWASIPNGIGRSRLPHPTVHLLLNLLTHSEGFSATYSTISQQTGMSSKTISSALDNLKKLGLITVTKVKGKEGRFDSNKYVFHADRLWQITPEYVDEKLRGKPAVPTTVGEPDRFTRESGTALQGKAAPLYKGKRKKEQGESTRENDQTPLPPTGAESALFEEPLSFADEHHPADPLDDQFNEFWKVYPHFNKVTKTMAKKSLGRALKKADFGTIMAGARNYALQCERERTEKKFVAHATTWLNQERWELSQDSLVNDSSPQNNDGLEVLRSMMGR